MLKNGTYASGSGIGTITISAFTCAGPLGWDMTVTQGTPAEINAVQPDATAGVTDVTVTGFSAHVLGAGCSFDATGGLPGTYANGTAALSLGPGAPNPAGVKLTASNVSGCSGIWNNGDIVTINPVYRLAPATITISTP